jgi:hypothetical protein
MALWRTVEINLSQGDTEFIIKVVDNQLILRAIMRHGRAMKNRHSPWRRKSSNIEIHGKFGFSTHFSSVLSAVATFRCSNLIKRPILLGTSFAGWAHDGAGKS